MTVEDMDEKMAAQAELRGKSEAARARAAHEAEGYDQPQYGPSRTVESLQAASQLASLASEMSTAEDAHAIAMLAMGFLERASALLAGELGLGDQPAPAAPPPWRMPGGG